MKKINSILVAGVLAVAGAAHAETMFCKIVKNGPSSNFTLQESSVSADMKDTLNSLQVTSTLSGTTIEAMYSSLDGSIYLIARNKTEKTTAQGNNKKIELSIDGNAPFEQTVEVGCEVR